MKNTTATLSLALAGALTTALAAIPASAEESTKEKCFGVSLKGMNDVVSRHQQHRNGAAAHEFAGDAEDEISAEHALLEAGQQLRIVHLVKQL